MCLNIYETHVTVNNSSYNNVEFFLVSDFKIVYYNNINPLTQYRGLERKNILHHYLFGYKIIETCLELGATHSFDNDLLLRQETKKKLHVLKVNIITIKIYID